MSNNFDGGAEDAEKQPVEQVCGLLTSKYFSMLHILMLQLWVLQKRKRAPNKAVGTTCHQARLCTLPFFRVYSAI